jgi:hypothetical protein
MCVTRLSRPARCAKFPDVQPALRFRPIAVIWPDGIFRVNRCTKNFGQQGWACGDQEALVEAIWRFVTDNRETLTWLGGGAIVVAGGAWRVAKFFLKREKPKPVSAVGGLAAGRDIRGSPTTITYTGKPSDGSST